MAYCQLGRGVNMEEWGQVEYVLTRAYFEKNPYLRSALMSTGFKV